MTAAFFATLAIAVVVIALLIWRETFWRKRLEQAQKDISAATERADEADRLRKDAEQSVQQQIAATETQTAEIEATAKDQVASIEARLAELEVTSGDRIAELERALRDAQTEAEARGAERAGAAGWPLLLARVERQWADVVNAGPDERGVLEASRREQLMQAVSRDLERLREEVGVQTTLTPSNEVDDGDPLTTLLAVAEAAALLASHSEHVLVDLNAPAVVSGEDWTGDDDARRRIDEFVTTASTAGLDATVKVDDRAAQVVLGVQENTT